MFLDMGFDLQRNAEVIQQMVRLAFPLGKGTVSYLEAGRYVDIAPTGRRA
jgi:hypothetical protein